MSDPLVDARSALSPRATRSGVTPREVTRRLREIFADTEEMTTTEIHDAFSHDVRAAILQQALIHLCDKGFLTVRREKTGGRDRIVWRKA